MNYCRHALKPLPQPYWMSYCTGTKPNQKRTYPQSKTGYFHLTLISVIVMRTPEQVRDLLAYSSTIVKASQDFQGAPWLEYDVHFRNQIATRGSPQWATIDAALWSMYFARANPKPTAGTSAKWGPQGQVTTTNPIKISRIQLLPGLGSPHTPPPPPAHLVCFRAMDVTW